MSSSLSVPLIEQLDEGFCLPACVQMVLAYWGVKRSQRRLARQLGTIEAYGTPGSAINRLASRSLTVHYSSGELEDLIDSIKSGVPVITLILTGQLPYWELNTAHAVVVIGFTENSLFLNDPVFPSSIIECPTDDFYLAWFEMQNLFGTIRPKT